MNAKSDVLYIVNSYYVEDDEFDYKEILEDEKEQKINRRWAIFSENKKDYSHGLVIDDLNS
ncbi:hypothetical protein [uncultured Photobacterium sp.]|uniref:hypothetical protein n=1 Tax=uncultured Photobacterium sp. TaxID=173973 RepID=UPI002636EB25|nr:hypothetical protein [uncultured Photobacterium sp.]